VLDVGGSRTYWDICRPILNPVTIVILNVQSEVFQNDQASPDIELVFYEGRHVPFRDGEFDLVICNSVFEHVAVKDRANLAREIERVGKRYVVQTPAFEFPIEPHFISLPIHWLPRAIGRNMACITPYAWKFGHQASVVFFDQTKLLTRRQLQSLFPRATLFTERFMGLPKSHLAVGDQSSHPENIPRTYSRRCAADGRSPELGTSM
jgi:SAM-dependent methyltransferase